MAKRPGRASIFRDKNLAAEGRRSSQLTPTGLLAFEKQRRKLAKLAGVEFVEGSSPSNSDVIEFLARGEDATVRYLERRT